MLNPPTPGVWPWRGKVLVLAAAYFVTGKLGLLLAVPPGYATCIWPPSGIALNRGASKKQIKANSYQ
jgi:integral membrane sensor domain MASE1